MMRNFGNSKNTNQQPGDFSINELSNKALAILANITSYSGKKKYIYILIFGVQYTFKFKMIIIVLHFKRLLAHSNAVIL